MGRPPAPTTPCCSTATYEVLRRIAPNPMVTLNHAAAVAIVFGPQARLDLLGPLDDDDRIARHHRPTERNLEEGAAYGTQFGTGWGATR